MRSDREEIPEGYTKEDADKAEIAEAKLIAQSRSRNARSSFSPTNVVAALAPTDCMNYWPALQYYVCGEIRVKYDSLGGPASFLLFPTTNELVNPDGFGRRNHFQNGPIYWSASTGAHPVVNHFHQKWGQFGYEGGWLGYPKTDEIVLNGGRLQDFQGATIYWSPLTGAHPVGGAIRDKWAQTGWEGGFLGYPVSDEIWVGVGGQGRMNRFQYGVIYWSSPTGAHPVYGPVLEAWAAAGYETGTYGYPIEDTVGTAGGGDSQRFQHGTISVSPPNLGNPPWRFAADKMPGPNYDDAVECVAGYDTGDLTEFVTGETLKCVDFRHIYSGHFPGYLNQNDWDDFQACLAYTLASPERDFEPNQPGMYGRTRYNTWSDVRSFAVVRNVDKSIYTAYTTGDGGRDWGGCRMLLP